MNPRGRNGVIPRPRCGHQLRRYRLNRTRASDYGLPPVCGLPAGHNPRQHESEESVQRKRQRRKQARPG